MGWLRLVGSSKVKVIFAKEPCKRKYILQERPIIARSLLIVATPYMKSLYTCLLGGQVKSLQVQGGEDSKDPLSCRSFSTKELLNIGHFYGKWLIKIRDPISLRHPVTSDSRVTSDRSKAKCTIHLTFTINFTFTTLRLLYVIYTLRLLYAWYTLLLLCVLYTWLLL